MQHIDVEDFQYFECNFAGLVAFDLKNGTFSKLASTCFSELKHNQYMSRHFFSKSSMLVLVLYVYVEYISVSLSLSFQTTECIKAEFNLCSLDMVDQIKPDGNVQRHMNFTFREGGLKMHLSLKDLKCVVLELSIQKGRKAAQAKSCGLQYLIVGKIPDYQMQYQIEGQFSGIWHLYL